MNSTPRKERMMFMVVSLKAQALKKPFNLAEIFHKRRHYSSSEQKRWASLFIVRPNAIPNLLDMG
jgi:hypothetical protein